MNKVKVAIVEDESIIAEDLSDILEEQNYEVVGIAKSFASGLELINSQYPDIILLDIKIKGDLDGIDLAVKVREEYHLPFVFISSHSDSTTVQRAATVNPYGYLIKPFEDDDVIVAIEIAMSNFAKENSISEDNFVLNNCLFVREKNLSVKVACPEILFIKADGNYSIIQTEKRSYTLRATLKDIYPKLPSGGFFRTHKSYIVNLENLSAVNSDSIYIKDYELPIGRQQLSELTKKLNKL